MVIDGVFRCSLSDEDFLQIFSIIHSCAIYDSGMISLLEEEFKKSTAFERHFYCHLFLVRV